MLQGSVTLKGGKSSHGSLLVVMGNTLSLLLSPRVLLSVIKDQFWCCRVTKVGYL